ncbi:hypothetical protein BKA63DRAFT_497394 [Paraphoma chrysanthemicola]|nr:hypothetical protein BKA63DRAFT_497394 [Paraphoma chrysanthemicola]
MRCMRRGRQNRPENWGFDPMWSVSRLVCVGVGIGSRVPGKNARDSVVLGGCEGVVYDAECGHPICATHAEVFCVPLDETETRTEYRCPKLSCWKKAPVSNIMGMPVLTHCPVTRDLATTQVKYSFRLPTGRKVSRPMTTRSMSRAAEESLESTAAFCYRRPRRVPPSTNGSFIISALACRTLLNDTIAVPLSRPTKQTPTPQALRLHTPCRDRGARLQSCAHQHRERRTAMLISSAVDVVTSFNILVYMAVTPRSTRHTLATPAAVSNARSDASPP